MIDACEKEGVLTHIFFSVFDLSGTNNALVVEAMSKGTPRSFYPDWSMSKTRSNKIVLANVCKLSD